LFSAAILNGGFDMTDTETKRVSREELIKRLSTYNFEAANSDASFDVLIEPLLNYNVTPEEARRICNELEVGQEFFCQGGPLGNCVEWIELRRRLEMKAAN
jgi:hypothetical protein